MDLNGIAFLREWNWAAQAFVVVLVSLTLDLIVRIFLSRLKAQLEAKTKNLWDDALVDALRSPASLLIWVVGITLAADIVATETDVALFDYTGVIRDMGIVVTLAWLLMRLVRNMEQAYLAHLTDEDRTLDQSTVYAVSRLVRLSILITAVLVGLQNLGISISGVLAVGGVGGVAIGFAAKDLLANFFGTVMIFLERPFVVGDWIRSPDKEIEGTVEHISWRLTRIRTFDKRPLYVPNATFSSISVENPSRMTNRRIYEIVGVRYDDIAVVLPIVNDIKAMLRGHADIDSDQTLIVNFNTFGPSSLDIMVYTFTRTIVWVEFHQVKQDVLLKIAEIIDRHGAEIAFPTSTIHLAGGLPELPGVPGTGGLIPPGGSGEA